MMARNPNSWSMNNGMHPQSQFVYASNSSNPSSTTASADPLHPSQEFPVRSWSQLLLGGLGGGEEERFGGALFNQQKKMENWDDQVMNLNPSYQSVDVKQESAQSSSCQIYDDEVQKNSWPHHHQVMPISSPTSCVTSLSNNIFNFSAAAAAPEGKSHLHSQDLSSECNSTITGGASKKARVNQHSSAQPALKVRKEKLGDRITALHQLVSPFGKTDTASVLSEAIGYIRFLQGQIEALSSPYMRNASVGTSHHPQHSVQERNCLFSEEDSQSEGAQKDLRSRGLCLVPISCTQNVGNETGADYWAPAALGGGF
ncbi:transcription factor bHLH68-like [Salvia hispanica]|uniref:transcription factor bHLH68-like n=1 Tax=Salvia hispanica TaxID=49212 RepID=UPI0020090D9C|nr:transcription factor bHLH68-like [Salvia hispanica]